MTEQIRMDELIVDDYTTPLLWWVSPKTSVAEANALMTKNSIRHLPIVENTKVRGIISSRDLTNLQELNVDGNVEVRTFCSDDVFTVPSGTGLDEVVFEMSERKIGSALVLDREGKIDGIFTSTDALNALVDIIRQ